ncbi:hypothetical protein NA57DRAFT_24675, partial [Rhizodiscina lignyota]
SPPASVGLQLPKKRPSITSLAGPPNPKRRKPSTAGPSHLRQTSFPPENAPSFSARSPSSTVGGTPRFSRSPSVESSLLGGAAPSLLSAATGTSRKRGGRKGKGARLDPAGDDADRRSVSGDTRSVKGRGAKGAAAEDDAGEAQEEDEDFDELVEGMVAEDRKMDEAAMAAERQKEAVLLANLAPDEAERYVRFRRAVLAKGTVRKLVNQTLSQSVPPSIVNIVQGYTKIFVGEIIDLALDVQLEWLAASAYRPVEVTDSTFPVVEPVGTVVQSMGEEKTEAHGWIAEEGREGLKERTKREFRGPLTPDHLREALRRYKKSVQGGAAGFMGFSGEGRENVAARAGGKKLFR